MSLKRMRLAVGACREGFSCLPSLPRGNLSPNPCEEGLISLSPFVYSRRMDFNPNARRLRRCQTEEERQVWKALRAGRFAGFKFRRQHPLGGYILDFYCPMARLSIELDGFQHGMPRQKHDDEARKRLLIEHDIEELRYWNPQWR